MREATAGTNAGRAGLTDLLPQKTVFRQQSLRPQPANAVEARSKQHVANRAPRRHKTGDRPFVP